MTRPQGREHLAAEPPVTEPLKITTELPCATFDLLRAIEGHPIVVRALDGTEVLLRLATPEELIASQRAAGADLMAKGFPADGLPPVMTHERATELVAPVDLDALVRAARGGA